MIKTLIFDFGDVFINLDKQGAINHALKLFNCNAFEQDMLQTNINYELGEISTQQFLQFYTIKFPSINTEEIIQSWNYIIKNFPYYRLEFIKKLAQDRNYKLILLSNTNAMHIEFIQQNVGFYEEFKSYFDAFYLSHEINLRKPNKDIYQFVLKENNLVPEECLFIDDTKDNTDTANTLGFKTWNIDENNEDVIHLFKTKAELF